MHNFLSLTRKLALAATDDGDGDRGLFIVRRMRAAGS